MSDNTNTHTFFGILGILFTIISFVADFSDSDEDYDDYEVPELLKKQFEEIRQQQALCSQYKKFTFTGTVTEVLNEDLRDTDEVTIVLDRPFPKLLDDEFEYVQKDTLQFYYQDSLIYEGDIVVKELNSNYFSIEHNTAATKINLMRLEKKNYCWSKEDLRRRRR